MLGGLCRIAVAGVLLSLATIPSLLRAQSGGTASIPFELHGVMRIGRDALFAVHNTRTHHTDWIRLHETQREFVAIEFDSTAEALTIEITGQRYVLALHGRRAVAEDLNAAAALMPPGAATGPQLTHWERNELLNQPPAANASAVTSAPR